MRTSHSASLCATIAALLLAGLLLDSMSLQSWATEGGNPPPEDCDPVAFVENWVHIGKDSCWTAEEGRWEYTAPPLTITPDEDLVLVGKCRWIWCDIEGDVDFCIADWGSCIDIPPRPTTSNPPEILDEIWADTFGIGAFEYPGVGPQIPEPGPIPFGFAVRAPTSSGTAGTTVEVGFSDGHVGTADGDTPSKTRDLTIVRPDVHFVWSLATPGTAFGALDHGQATTVSTATSAVVIPANSTGVFSGPLVFGPVLQGNVEGELKFESEFEVTDTVAADVIVELECHGSTQAEVDFPVLAEDFSVFSGGSSAGAEMWGESVGGSAPFVPPPPSWRSFEDQKYVTRVSDFQVNGGGVSVSAEAAASASAQATVYMVVSWPAPLTATATINSTAQVWVWIDQVTFLNDC